MTAQYCGFVALPVFQTNNQFFFVVSLFYLFQMNCSFQHSDASPSMREVMFVYYLKELCVDVFC